MTEHLRLIQEHMKLSGKVTELYMGMPSPKWNQEEQKYLYDNPEDEAVAKGLRAQVDAILKAQKKLARQLRALGGVEIKNPENIFGARVTTRFQRVDEVSCNYLDKITLSDTKCEGIIYTPFKFLTDGTTMLDTKTHRYKIKRDDSGKVYWLFTIEDYSLTLDEK